MSIMKSINQSSDNQLAKLESGNQKSGGGAEGMNKRLEV